MGEIVKRITSYVSGASQTVQLPIAEAMLTYKEKKWVYTIHTSIRTGMYKYKYVGWWIVVLHILLIFV